MTPLTNNITTTQLHSTKRELRFCTGSSPAPSVSEILIGEDLYQWSLLEIRLNTFCWSTIPQKQFIVIIFTRDTIQSWALFSRNKDLGRTSWINFERGLIWPGEPPWVRELCSLLTLEKEALMRPWLGRGRNTFFKQCISISTCSIQ